MTPPDPPPDPAQDGFIDRLASRTLRALETEYPTNIRLTLDAPPTGPITPRSIYPAFYGCYDWHSAVHSHWQVVRAMRMTSDARFREAATGTLDRTLTTRNIAIEMAWLDGRPGFEMPYGMAWLLRLCHELTDWDDERSRRWLDALRPMQDHAVVQFERYCRSLTVPMRGGLHNQSAFSLGLVWDSLRVEDATLRDLITEAAVRFYGADTDVDLRLEPSAADFLSPSASEADLMRRVLPPSHFVTWLERFTPNGFVALRPVHVVDPSNGQLAHWAGLNLSRSWMMSAIAGALPIHHDLVDGLRATAAAHADVGIASASHDEYMISHWVPTFAVYLLTDTG